MGDTLKDAVAVTKAKPTLSMPPRGSMDALSINWSGLGFSPGPMTLVSSFLSDQSSFSFSQLLAGATTSPVMGMPGVVTTDDAGKEKEDNIFDDVKTGESGGSGYKRSRPMNLVVGQPPGLLEPQSMSPVFMFTPGLSPSGLLNSPGFLSPLQSPFGMSHQQALAHVTAQAAFSQSYLQMQEELQLKSSTAATDSLPHQSSSAVGGTLVLHENTLPALPINSMIDSPEVSRSDRKLASIGGNKPANDGYNWRKYGQKHVKASECPRSYYKCTHLNCPVKKKVERSLDGQISDITYKGQHNHEPPQSNKRRTSGSAMNTQVKSAFDLPSQTEQNGLGGAITINSEPQNFQASTQKFEQMLAADDGEIKDAAIITIDGEDDGPVAKRRSIESRESIPASFSQQSVTESKIVVQTRSEVDLLDDGFKWRKYGQKVVKGNPHPRSYYRCTFSGCDVRKHVERSSADSRCVVTTYEGKHNHDIPVGRYSKPSSANSNINQLQTQKLEVKNPARSDGNFFGNKDQIPVTLEFKEEQIAAA